MKKILSLALLVASCSAVLPAAELDLNAEAERFSQMYFAPMDGGNFCRLFHPDLGMVEFRRRWKSHQFIGAAGWRAEEDGQGTVVVQPPDSPCLYQFLNGRPQTLVAGERKLRMSFEEEPVIPGGIPELWEGAEEDAEEFFWKKWPGRFAPFYKNPNHSCVLFTSFLLVAFWVFMYAEKRWLAVLGLAGTVVFGWLTVKTEARTGFVAAGAGLLILWGFRFLKPRGRWRLGLLGLLGVGVVAFFLCGGNLGRLALKTKDAGSVMRFETWRATPRMMVESPWGWGKTTSGRAYSDWYQPINANYVTPTLTSDHLTHMVALGWCGRFVWVFGWFALFAVLCRFACKGGSPLPLALMFALGFSAVGNPILGVKMLWLVPLASLALVLQARPWRDWRSYRWALGFAGAAALAVLLAFYIPGRKDSKAASLPVRTNGHTVILGKGEPRVWVVDDRYTLGWLFAPKLVRNYYMQTAETRPFGYTEEIKALPRRVKRLVVAGRKCEDYLALWSRGKAPQAEELVFISPPFALSDVPLPLRQACRFMMVLGEFAARYVDVYGPMQDSAEIGIATGAEVYIPGWVDFALGK